MRYGVSYYPEHKTKEDLEHDLQLLKDAGINTVRMGEFAWCRMEPKEGEYSFAWLEEVVNALGTAGIQTILCTPTACPPAWLIAKYPDILYMDNRRIRRPFGGRRHYCYNNENYREYSAKIVEKLSAYFAENPYIAGIQIDNEPAQEGTGRCSCPECQDKFQQYLEKKYHSIGEYNRRSGSIFWSQEYDSFKQLQIPVNTIEVGAENQIQAYYENPTLRLEFERFASESQTEYQNLQVEILKKYFKVPVTTNGTGLATNSIDYYESSKALDCYGFDYYPGLRDAKVDSYPYAHARGVKNGKPFWVLEFMSGGGHKLGGTGRTQPNPGALKQAVVHSMAHGAEMMLHFQFRTYPFGAEQLNYAIVDMDGVPRRRYKEMQETAKLLETLRPLEKASFPKEVAVCFDYDSHWALRIKPVNDPKFHYIDYCGKLYRLLEQCGVTADVVSFKEDWDSYKVILVPAAIIMDEETQDKLKTFVQNGGIVLATFLTSVKNKDNVGYTKTLPAGLTDLFGSTVEEVDPVFDNATTLRLKKSLSKEESAETFLETKDNIWSELLGGDSMAVGSYTEDYKEGSKVISSFTYGKGQAYYLGTDIEDDAYWALLKGILEEGKVKTASFEREDGVEIVSRLLEGKDIVFVFNFTAKETIVKTTEGYTDFLTKQPVCGEFTIERNGFKILEKLNG